MSEISDFDAFVKERKEKLNAPKQDYKLDYVPAEVVAYKNELNEQVAEVEHDTNYAALGGSIGVELGAGIYASHKLKTGKRYMNSLRNAKYAMNIFRGIQAANTATAYKSITPWGAAAQIGGYGLAEAGIWATSNFFGQQIRTAYGLQDDQNISETMSAALFGVVAAPVEKVFEAGKLAQKAFKLSDGLVDLKAWKGREFMVNGTNKFISGAVLGLTESAFRQEIAIMLNEQENRDIYDYMLSGGIGGSLNSVIGMWAKTGAWGRQQEATMYARTKKSVQEQIDEIDAQLTETAKGTTDRRALASKKRTLRLKRKELEEVLEITDEMETKTTQSSEFAAQQEVTPQGEPKQAPKLSLDENVTVAKEAPATNKDAEYERLVKEDPEAARKMLREEAEANGYDTEAFHGTHSEGIKEFAGGTHFGSKGAANKRNADVRKNIEVERDNTLSSLTKQNPTISKYFDVENDADVQAIYQKYRDKYKELDTDGRGFGGESVDSKPVRQELIAIQNETDALILQKLKEGLKKQKDDLEIERQKALEGANTPKLKAKVNEVYDDLIKRDTEVSKSLILSYEEAVNSLTRGSTVMPVFIKTGNVKRTVDVEGVDEMGNPIEGGSRSITDDFEEGVNTLQYTNKFEGDESFVIKDSEQAKSGELIATDKDGNIIPLSQRFKGQEAPATPKDTPEATPAPLQDAETGKAITIKGYHGTKTKFDELDPKVTSDDKPYSFGSHFTTSKSEAEVYATSVKRAADTKKGKPIKMEGDENVIEADITLENPLVIKTDMTTASMYADVNRANILKTIEDAKAKGIEYDGVIIQRRKGNGEGDHDNIIIFDNTKAKRIEAPEPTPAPKDAPDISNVPTEGITSSQVDDILNDFETVYQKAVADGEESIIAETLIDKTRRIYDNADFDMENIIDEIGKNPESITPDTLRNLIDKVDVQIKLLNGIYGRLNALGGRVVRMNRQDVSPTANSTFSQATELTSEALYRVKKKAQDMLGDAPAQTTKDDVVPASKDAPEVTTKTKVIDSKQQQNAELFEEIYSYVTREAEMEALRPFFKGLRTVRMLRKLSMVNSLTSAQAALPTGAFELFKLLPRAVVSRASAIGKDDVTQRLALADYEAFLEGFKFLTDKKTFGDLFHHMRRTFKEGRDPNYNSATRFDDETLVSKNIMPSGSAKIMRDAAAKAREAAIGQEATLRWARERLKLGKFMEFMSLGARAIMATDAGFKRQLRFANGRAEATKKAILADPTNPNFRQEADKILDSWTKDKGGLGILGDIEELADGNRYIDEALLMTSRTDNVQDVARNFTEEILIRPITKLLNDDSTKKGVLLGTAIEALMPFYSVGVRSVSKMAGLANPFRVLSRVTNPYDDIIRDLESKKGQFKILVKNRTRRGQTKEAARAATQVRQLDERIRMAEGRRVNYNKEVLTDVLIQLSFGTAAFTAGYLGYATGTNSWMTADQKRKNPNKGAYQMFGIDYRAAVPVNLLIAMAADMGNYMRASQDGQISKKMGNVQVMLNAVSNSMVDLPLAQGVKDIQSVFSENYDFEASVSEIVSSYVPVPSQAKKFVRKITSGEDLVDLRGGSFSDRMIYHVFGAAPPNRQVDILGQFKESTKTWGHTINRFASSKEIEYQPYQERIASDHDGALAGRLPAGFDAIPRGQDMTNFVDEDGRTLHQHFALRLQETDIVERVNEFVTSSDFYDIYGLTVDDGEIRKNMGLKAMQSMLNGYYRQVKAEMQSDPSFLSRFVNDNDENLLELIENNKALQEIEYPKPL